MIPLTKRVATLLKDNDTESANIYNHVRKYLPDDAHIEHVLSHLGDLISLANRSKKSEVEFEKRKLEKEHLEALYQQTVAKIRDTIRFGFHSGGNGEEDRVGTKDDPIVDVSHHREFIRMVFRVGQAGVDKLRPRVRFFTTNYDTLLEDALSFEQIECIDGFSGGAIGFWDVNAFDRKSSSSRAVLYKLHGSIDWYFDSKKDLIKCRDNLYQSEYTSNDVLIYPQQTKYLATQRDPFSQLFKRFRDFLVSPHDQVLVICGYSFGDDHINLEIENAMAQPQNNTTLLCFVNEPRDSVNGRPYLPKKVQKWLDGTSWSKRIFVLTDKGLYWGDTKNRHLPPDGSEHTWWTFKGVTELLNDGVM